MRASQPSEILVLAEFMSDLQNRMCSAMFGDDVHQN